MPDPRQLAAKRTNPLMSPGITRPARKRALLALFVMAAAFMTFEKTLGFDFVKWDDDIQIYNNPYIRQLDGASLRWMFSDIAYVRRYIPLGWLSWALNYRLGGLAPFGYHLGNVLFHVANTGLAFWLIGRILRARCVLPATQQDFIAAAATLFWAIHPLRAEPVAWSNGRIYTQCLFFLLVSVHCYLNSQEPVRPRASRRLLFAASLGAYILSLLSYGTSLGYPVVLLALDIFVLGRVSSKEHSGRHHWPARMLLEKAPFALAAAAYLGVTLWARHKAAGFWTPAPTLEEFGVLGRLAQASYMLLVYFWRTLVPAHLSPVYTDLVWIEPLSFPFLASMSLVAFTTLLAVLWRQRRPALLAFWICHVALLFPMLGLTERPHYPSDRYSYIQGILWSVALALAVGVVLKEAGRLGRIAVAACALLSTGVLGVLASKQATVWTNSGTLFSHALLKLGDDPYQVDIAWRLGFYLLGRKQYFDAITYFDQALARVPRHLEASLYKGKALEALGKTPEAVKLWRRALETEDDPRVRLCLGRGLLHLDQPAEARGHLERLLVHEPEHLEARLLNIHALRRLGAVHIARDQLSALAALHPDHLEVRDLIAALATEPGFQAQPSAPSAR